jgi:hypothetical protein
VILGRRGPQYLSAVVAIELSIRGTFLGPFETPVGVIWPTGAKLDIPDRRLLVHARLQDPGVQGHIGARASMAAAIVT